MRSVWAFVDGLDLSALHEAIKAREGQPGHPPAAPQLMLALWLWATVDGVGSARALDRKDPVAAREHAERARAEALAGRSATGYVAAAVALAALADATGDRLGAYASLAVGWATLRDLVGADGARAAFQPHLVALRSRWGPAAFARVKAAYEGTVLRA